MMSRKYGREVVNYFSGSPLNRLSFLRTDHAFLRAAFSHSSARFLLLDNLNPLVEADKSNLAFAKFDEVEPLTGSDPFAKTEEELIKDFNSEEPRPLIVFIGVDDKNQMPDSATGDAFQYRDYKGSPYFAVDVTPRGKLADKATGVATTVKARGLKFFQGIRPMSLPAGEAAFYGQARALIDWNTRNPFCGQCGQPTLSVNAGTKRACPPTDLACGTSSDRLPCATRGGISNLSFPRTDPTVIMAVISADGSRLLLGRSKRFPPGLYSVLAGFLEPGESVEEAVRREVWEESGVTLARVAIHSSQPWPFPANLMLGAIGQAGPGEAEKIHLGHDPELEDAKWFSVEEVAKALKESAFNIGQEKLPELKEGELRLPPRTAIANTLLTAVIDGYIGALPKI